MFLLFTRIYGTLNALKVYFSRIFHSSSSSAQSSYYIYSTISKASIPLTCWNWHETKINKYIQRIVQYLDRFFFDALAEEKKIIRQTPTQKKDEKLETAANKLSTATTEYTNKALNFECSGNRNLSFQTT